MMILMTLNQQLKEIPKWNTPLISCTVLVYEQLTKYYLYSFMLVQVPSDNLEYLTIWHPSGLV